MKIRAKLILITILLLIPIILIWSITDILITKNTENHSHEIIKFYASTLALTIGREYENADKESMSIFDRRKDLEDFIKDIEAIKKVDLVILDTTKTIIADVFEKNIGIKYETQNNEVINNAIYHGTNGTIREYSKDYPKGISLYVCPIKNERGKIMGVLLMQYDNLLKGLRAEAKNTQRIFVGTGIILLIVLGYLGLVYEKMLTSCIDKIVFAVRKFASGDYSARINTKRKDELGEISNAIDQMVEQKQKNDEEIRLLSNAMKSSNDLISITNKEAKFIFVNDAFCKTYGYVENEILGKSVALISSDKNNTDFNKLYNHDTYANGWYGERWSKTKDGKEFLVNLHLSPVKNIKEELLGLVSVSNDITSKKLAEEALRISEEKFRLVFENIPVGIIYASPKGKLINCNEIFLTMLNITKEEFQNFDFSQIQDADFKEAFRLAFSGIIGRYEGDYKSVLSKKVISLKVALAPIVNDDKITGIVGIFEDISELKQLERFFFHDILNTAGILRSYIELLNDETFDGEEKEESTKQIQAISDQLIKEIMSHRSILTSDKTKMKLNIELINSLDFLKIISNNFQKVTYAQNINIIINKEAENVEVKTDRALLGRTIENLIKNAIEASNAGQTVSLGLKQEENKIIFCVHNNNFIPEDIQRKIFHRSFSTKGGGRGIGTYSIKYLTENYLKGEVYFKSDIKEGTSFYVRIPIEIKENGNVL